MTTSVAEQRLFVPLTASGGQVVEQRLFVPMIATGVQVMEQRLFVPMIVDPNPSTGRRRQMSIIN